MTTHRTRRSVLAAAGAAGVTALAGCSDLSLFTEEGEQAQVGEPIETVTPIGDDPPSGEPVDSPPIADRELVLPVPLEEMADHAQDGGPGKDGIPSIDDPVYIGPEEVRELDPDSVVFGVAAEGDAKAFPRRIMVRHEIVNDELAGIPVSITYCPLTGTAQGFRRGGTEFGVSGELVNNNLIMYDREAERWWPQIAATSIPGPWSDSPGGATLEEFEIIRTTFEQWREQYPETRVLSPETGFARDYDRDPYGERGYYQIDSTMFANIYENDELHAKRWVYGARTAEGAVAFTRDRVHEEGVVSGELGETPVIAVHDRRLDTAYLYRNPEQRTFTRETVAISDESGESHPPEDLPLERIISFDAYWFAWFAYYPNTTLYQ